VPGTGSGTDPREIEVSHGPIGPCAGALPSLRSRACLPRALPTGFGVLGTHLCMPSVPSLRALVPPPSRRPCSSRQRPRPTTRGGDRPRAGAEVAEHVRRWV